MFAEICLPIFNEEKLLEKNTLKLLNYCQQQKFNFNWRIVIINNGSTDQSFSIAEQLAALYPRRIKHVYTDKPGRGRALKQYWIKSQVDYFVYMDMDLAVDLKHLNDLFGNLNTGYNLVIGSRLLPDSQIDRPLIREITSQTYNLLCRLVLGYKFSDLQCGFKAIDRFTFLKLAPYLEGTHWFFDTEIVILSKHFGYKVKELPVVWEEKRYDQRESKVNILQDSFKYIIEIFQFKKRLNKIKKAA